MPAVCAIVLAAGRSRRMGAQKLLLPLGGRPVIVRVVDELLRCDLARVLVVVNPSGGPIREALAGREVEFVLNEAPESEMLDSLRCALRAVPPACDWILVMPADHPGIDAATVHRLLEAARDSKRGIVAPVWNGRRGHPLLIARRHREELLRRHDAVGLRGLLAAHPDDILEVASPTPAILQDLDTPADYAAAARRHREDTSQG